MTESPWTWVGAVGLAWILLEGMAEAGASGLAIGLAIAIAFVSTMTSLRPALNQIGFLRS